MEKLEYNCPYCYEWVLKTDFRSHQLGHWNDPKVNKAPETLEELKQRFIAIGGWEER
jgi:hypothetical protein